MFISIISTQNRLIFTYYISKLSISFDISVVFIKFYDIFHFRGGGLYVVCFLFHFSINAYQFIVILITLLNGHSSKSSISFSCNYFTFCRANQAISCCHHHHHHHQVLLLPTHICSFLGVQTESQSCITNI